MAILKLTRDNPKREIHFELQYQLSLTTRQRFAMMLKKSAEIKKMLRSRGHRKSVEVIKRS